MHPLAEPSLVFRRHVKFDVYSIKESNEMAIFQRFKLSHWLRAHRSNLTAETFKSAIPNSFHYQLYSTSSQGMSMRLFFNLEEKNSNWLPLISKKAFPSLPFLSSCLRAEVFLPRDCVADTVERYSVYSHPFSLLHHSP